MRINNNLMAMNTHRQYSINNGNVSKSVEKLSSGYRINRAGDDAAGLAISEKMRAQIRGLNMASKNSQDGISLIQTAEGALQESHNILQRMRELAVQSASDTNETTIDRDALNKEFQAMLDEIDDTAAKTTFNDLGLIDGTFAKYKVPTNPDGTSVTNPNPAFPAPTKLYADALAQGAKETATVQFSINSTTLPGTTTPGTAEVAATSATTTGNTLANSGTSVNVTFTATTLTPGADMNGTWDFTYNGTAFEASNGTVTIVGTTTDPLDAIPNTSGTATITFAGLGTLTIANTGGSILDATDSAFNITGTITASGGTDLIPAVAEVTAGDNAVLTYSYTDSTGTPQTVNVTVFPGQTRLQLENGVAIDFVTPIAPDFSNLSSIFGSLPANISADIIETGIEFIVQTGANKGDELNLNIDKMDSKTLGIFGTDITRRENASWAIQHMNRAVNTVSTQRAALGAMQNRMEHKIANLDTSSENLASAESRIRDLDMAKEMTSFTKNNILSQASTAMLAQANSLPQGVLQLLQ